MRPSQAKRGGGGFLNGVTALFTGYQFVLSADQEIKKGKRAGQTWSPISFVPSFRLDGADEDVSQRLLFADADRVDATVSEDGLTVTLGPDAVIFADNETMIFLQSLIDSGFPESNLNDDPTILNVEPAVGSRLVLVQTVNAEKTKQQGKQKGKDGKEYDRKDLKVSEVLALPAAKASKPAAKGKAGKAAKGPDVSELAASTLTDILGDNDGSIALAKLKMKVFAAFGVKHPQRDQRDAVIAYLTNADNLSAIDDVEFDGTTISIAA